MLGNFVCARFRFTVEARTPLRFGTLAGATLRGGFGHVFKRTVCIWPSGDCPRCLLKSTCAYPYVFETAPPPGAQRLRTLAQVPRPYVLEPPDQDLDGAALTYAPGQHFDFRLVLVGRAIDYLPYFVFTFSELGRVGFGKDRGLFELSAIHAEGLAADQCIYQASEGVLHSGAERLTEPALVARAERFAGDRHLTVLFLTPARIRSDGVVQAEVTFQDLVRALLRRLSSLCYFHCGTDLDVDYRGLIEQAGQAVAESRLRWHDQARFSGRQKQRIDMGGVLGEVTFEVPQAEFWQPFQPLLAAGEWVHVGKGTVMGLGKYRLRQPKGYSSPGASALPSQLAQGKEPS